MVEIIKGSKTLKVPVGAYNAIYASAGWSLKGKEKKVIEKPVEPVEEVAEESIEPDFEEPVEDDNVEYVDPEELAEKPLEELDFEELKILAEYKGIDITGMRSSKALRKAIKSIE